MSTSRGRLLQRIVLAGLLLGAVVNLAAGARRPTRERAILAGDHYAHADSAARAVNRLVPAGEPVAIVVYDGDMIEELDAAIWFDYRSKWLLYPRHLEVFRVDPAQPLRRVTVPGLPPPVSPEAGYLRYRYVLYFRATAEPTTPRAPFQVLEQDPKWLLTENETSGAAPRGLE